MDGGVTPELIAAPAAVGLTFRRGVGPGAQGDRLDHGRAELRGRMAKPESPLEGLREAVAGERAASLRARASHRRQRPV